ncbi:MAG: hypothetical protein D3X82_13295 [Candidatus Leucobacter sulfamidivorax]|nr:hypothetical protein [Candidatus Leucobacter sulfamidivorax]
MKKRGIVLLVSIIGGVLLLSLIVGGLLLPSILWERSVNRYNEAFLDRVRALEGVTHVEVEIGHPGVPTNNDCVILLAIDFDSERQLTSSLGETWSAAHEELSSCTNRAVYVVNTSGDGSSDAPDRDKFFRGSSVLGGRGGEEMFEAAVGDIPGATAYGNAMED